MVEIFNQPIIQIREKDNKKRWEGGGISTNFLAKERKRLPFHINSTAFDKFILPVFPPPLVIIECHLYSWQVVYKVEI